MIDRPKYSSRGGEVWERTEDGLRELFAADAVARLTDLERKLAEAREALEKIEDHFINGHDTYADHEFMGEIAQEALARIDANINTEPPTP